MDTLSYEEPGGPYVALVAHLRDEHAQMRADLDHLSRALVQAPQADFPASRARLEDWIAHVLVPHADQEEVTYALVSGLDAGPALMDSMEAEHRILREAAGRFSGVWHPRSAGAWARSLYAAFDAHQHKEDELLFPRLLAA